MPMTMSKKGFAEYKEMTGEYHEADPNNPMNNKDRTSKFPDGKKKTDFRYEEKRMAKKRPGMMKGGMANKKVHMYAAGGMVKDYSK